MKLFENKVYISHFLECAQENVKVYVRRITSYGISWRASYSYNYSPYVDLAGFTSKEEAIMFLDLLGVKDIKVKECRNIFDLLLFDDEIV